MIKLPIKAMALLSSLYVFNTLAVPFNIECVLRGGCVDTQNVMEHLKELQHIADDNKGNRSAGSTGHELSANYVAQQLLAAGYEVQLEPFSFLKFTKIAAGLSTSEIVYEKEKEFATMSYSGSGSVSSAAVGVDLQLGAGNKSTSGCEKEDFASFPRGQIALIQRGTCAFGDKVLNAQAAGASGVILFNQGNSADREAIFTGTLSEGTSIRIPTVAVSYPFALTLLAQPELVINLAVKSSIEKKVSFNVIAETKTGNPNSVVMIGAHLDSVAEGPGINDNGSGSAGILEVALKMKDIQPTNKVRFAWFSAEELGLIGSTKYVESLSDIEKQNISLFINIDMIGSPNYKISVYDGDGSKFGHKGPEGSAQIEQKFHNFFSTIGIKSVETELNGRSDYAAFSAAGIAVGGIFTGAEAAKTAEEAMSFGGVAGEAYDVCYHKACDSINNINQDALEANTAAIAYILLSFADSASEVRKVSRFMTLNVKRRPVVFPKHLHCHEDVFDK